MTKSLKNVKKENHRVAQALKILGRHVGHRAGAGRERRTCARPGLGLAARLPRGGGVVPGHLVDGVGPRLLRFGRGPPLAAVGLLVNEIIKTKEHLNRILSANTGQPYEKVAADTERDYFMSSAEAKEYGLIDNVFEKRT